VGQNGRAGGKEPFFELLAHLKEGWQMTFNSPCGKSRGCSKKKTERAGVKNHRPFRGKLNRRSFTQVRSHTTCCLRITGPGAQKRGLRKMARALHGGKREGIERPELRTGVWKLAGGRNRKTLLQAKHKPAVQGDRGKRKEKASPCSVPATYEKKLLTREDCRPRGKKRVL